MATVIRSWRIEADQLFEIPELSATEQGLLEKRLERWLAAKPESIQDDLLIIGKQVSTASGPLDLLGINSEGVLVVVELKRDRAPRETVAQAIDYASWIAEQAVEEIHAIAADYLGMGLDEAFRQKFGQSLSELDPSSPSIVVVASRLDSGTERMIQFLSRQYQMDIDAIVFRYMKLPSGEEILLKTSVVSEERRADRVQRNRPTADALMHAASERGALPVLERLRLLNEFLTEIPDKTYNGSFRYWVPGRMLCGVNAVGYWGAPERSVDVWVTYRHWAQAYGLEELAVVALLKTFSVIKEYAGSHQLILRISDVETAIRFVDQLRAWSSTKPENEEPPD